MIFPILPGISNVPAAAFKKTAPAFYSGA